MGRPVNTPQLSDNELNEIVSSFKESILGVDYVLAVDFEATCCDDNSFPRRESEIIEFGCALVNNQTREIVSTFSAFVTPQIHKTLTAFCTQLTSITQEDVDGGQPFKVVAKSVADWLHTNVRLAGKTMAWISWGQYDFNKLIEDCSRARVNNPLGGVSHYNMKGYEGMMSRSREKGLKGAVNHYGLTWHGVHHRGVDDAINVANLYLKLSEKW